MIHVCQGRRREQHDPAPPTPAERIEDLQQTIAVLVADRLHLAKLLASYAVELSGQVERGAA